MSRFFGILKRNRSVQIFLPPVISFDEFWNAFDVLRENAYFLGEMAGIIACQTVPFLENWVIENWSKGDVPIPLDIQQLYNEVVEDFYQRRNIKLQ
ncbi:MAG: hypothetical protein AAB689_01905 [Patescibacteria group bacterium]